MSKVQPILINGEWIASKATRTFRAVNPATKEEHHIEFPVSPWEECDAACQAAYEASVQMRGWPGDRFGAYLDAFADRIEKRAEELITTANLETGYPIVPRLQDVELPRTINQMRQGAKAARDGSWCNAVIDTAAGIRSMLGPAGPVCVFGPNNFPFAFNGAAGGDFVAAVAAGNPVIAKGHSSHPRTTQIFAEEALKAARETGMPKAMIREARTFSPFSLRLLRSADSRPPVVWWRVISTELVYRTSHEDGYKLVAHPRLAGTGYTGTFAYRQMISYCVSAVLVPLHS